MSSHLFHDVKKGKKGSLADFIKEQFRYNRDVMAEIYRGWTVNLAWVRGYQNSNYDYSNKKWYSSSSKPNKPWKPRLQANLMLPVARRSVEQLIKFTNQWDVIPASSDEKDLEISRTSKKILQYYWQFLDMPVVSIRLAFWQSICSSAFARVGWDKDGGDEITVASKDLEDDLVQKLLELQGIGTLPESVTTQSGEVFIDPVPSFNLMFEPGAAILNDAGWSIESQIRTKDWVVETFGAKFKSLQETDNQEFFLYPYIHGQQKGKIPQRGILIHEFFAKKSKKHKEGLHTIITDDGTVIISPEDNPFRHKQLPYSHSLEIYDPASFHGTNVVEQIRPQQALYNKINNVIIENVNLMSNVQWLNPNKSVKTFTNKPGGVIDYKHPLIPTQTQQRPLPAYVERLLERTRLDMQDVASNHDVSEAKAEPGIRSGKAVLALQDADSSIKGPVLLWWDNAMARMGNLLLQTITQFTDEDKIIQIQGEFNQIETVTFNKEMLSGSTPNGNYFKVRVKTFGRQPLTRSARESLASQLIQLQLLNPQQHREELLDILGVGDIVSIFDQSAVDRTRQWNEIQQIVAGEQITVYFGQNHDAHIRAIKKYISSSQWDQLEPDVKQEISSHLANHLEQQAIEAVFQQVFIQSQLGGQNGSAEGRSQATGSGNGQQVRTAGAGSQARG